MIDNLDWMSPALAGTSTQVQQQAIRVTCAGQVRRVCWQGRRWQRQHATVVLSGVSWTSRDVSQAASGEADGSGEAAARGASKGVSLVPEARLQGPLDGTRWKAAALVRRQAGIRPSRVHEAPASALASAQHWHPHWHSRLGGDGACCFVKKRRSPRCPASAAASPLPIAHSPFPCRTTPKATLSHITAPAHYLVLTSPGRCRRLTSLPKTFPLHSPVPVITSAAKIGRAHV